MEEKRVTQKDVARAAGVTRPAVSLAFKKHPSIPEATRERIFRIAEQLGYRPDPMLSALAAYRLRLRPASFQGTLAWLVNVREGGGNWSSIPTYRNYYAGASEQASRRGYKLEVFDLARRGMNPERMARVLQARNISGILLCPQLPVVAEMEFPWEHFSLVTFGYTLRRPVLHTVTPTQYRGVLQIVRQLHARGYRRIGFAVNQLHDERIDHNYLAGYLVGHHLAPELQVLPPLPCDNDYPEPLRAWLREHRPDAIIAGAYNILQTLKKMKIRVPEDIGVACPLLSSPSGDLSGIFEDSVQVGRVATDLVVDLIHRGERGVPAMPQRVHVECHWYEGNSLRPLPAGVTAEKLAR